MPNSAKSAPRIREPQRVQGEIRFEIPDTMVSSTHAARLIWDVLGTLDLTGFAKGCDAVEGRAGRSLLSPRMVLTLWLYAISQGVGSARAPARRWRAPSPRNIRLLQRYCYSLFLSPF